MIHYEEAEILVIIRGLCILITKGLTRFQVPLIIFCVSLTVEEG